MRELAGVEGRQEYRLPIDDVEGIVNPVWPATATWFSVTPND